MSGLCQVPTPELGSCPAHSPRAAQGHESFPCTHTENSLQHGQGLPGLCCHCQSLAGTSALQVSPCPALPCLKCPTARGMDTGSSVLRSSSQPCTQGFPGDVTLWKLQEQLKEFVLTGFMSPHTGFLGLWSVHVLQTQTLTQSLDVPPWREEQPL